MVYAIERMTLTCVRGVLLSLSWCSFFSELASVMFYLTMKYVNGKVCLFFMMATYTFSVLVCNLF